VKPTLELPDDPALPGLTAIRSRGLARAIPSLGIDDSPVEVRLCGYTPGQRATLEVRAGSRRVAVKAYATNPAAEAALYKALGTDELAPRSGICVPPLLFLDRKLRIIVIGWLEGPTVLQLIRRGEGERAGYVAARWFRRAAALDVRLGPRRGAAHALRKAQEGILDLGIADRGLGSLATALLWKLVRTRPRDGRPRLVHGTLYDRHILDLGNCTGVIDWQRFGRGPLEMDAGVFLATISRTALRHEPLAEEVSRAEKSFREGTAGILDESSMAWHQAAALLRLAAKPVSIAGGERLRAKGLVDPRAAAISRARTLLDKAALVAEPVFREYERIEPRTRAHLPALGAHAPVRAETFKDRMQSSRERIE
jgi:phosphotransferase family enzyme